MFSTITGTVFRQIWVATFIVGNRLYYTKNDKHVEPPKKKAVVLEGSTNVNRGRQYVNKVDLQFSCVTSDDNPNCVIYIRRIYVIVGLLTYEARGSIQGS